MVIINKKTKMNPEQKLSINIIHKDPYNNFESKQFSNTLNKEIINIYNLQKGTNSNLLNGTLLSINKFPTEILTKA